MTEFLNSYQFIPTTGKINNKNTPTTAYKDLASTHIRHDYWDKDSFSGRVVCEVHLLSPTVVGNNQTPGTEQQAGTLTSYKDGQAIPANSLRGMVSSVAEALSQSALRVLEQSAYSVRKEVGNGLSAIGQLKVEQDACGQMKYSLKPLCLPTLDITNNPEYSTHWLNLFGHDTPLTGWLPAYINGYNLRELQESQIKKGFIKEKNPNCFHGEREVFYYAKLHDLNQSISDPIKPNSNIGLHIKTTEGKDNKIRHYLLGQKLRLDPPNPIITQQEFDNLGQADQAQYTRGIIHVFGVDGRETEIPKTKKHEKFIPFLLGKYDENINLLTIPNKVIDDFTAITQQCAEDSKNQNLKRPFLPQGYRAHKNETDYWQPANGELVYFDINPSGEVTEISYSSIWRKKIDGDSYQAFAKISPNLLPWGNKLRKPNQEGVGLTPAEQLFGVVAEAKSDTTLQSYNLASRLRFSDAICLTPIKLPEEPILLKILASPKPPSPCMYFKNPNGGGYIAKKDLVLNRDHPNGRKVYLHHAKSSIEKELWQSQKPSDNLKQKLSCKPMPTGSRLYFHIDFNNLSWDELSLLMTAIAPNEQYCHRLGLGKPLGLGSVKLDVCGLFGIDRIQRYTSLNSPRYAVRFQDYQWPDDLNQHYPLEKQCIDSKPLKKNKAYSRQLIDTETLAILCALGDRDNQTQTVTYPYTINDNDNQRANGEQEGFAWFVENAKKHIAGQFLQPLNSLNIKNGKLPNLNSIHHPQKSSQNPQNYHKPQANKNPIKTATPDATGRLIFKMPVCKTEEKDKFKKQIENYFVEYKPTEIHLPDQTNEEAYIAFSKFDLDDAYNESRNPKNKLIINGNTIVFIKR